MHGVSLVLAAFATLSQVAQAAPEILPQTTVVVTPAKLREQLMTSNTSVLTALNSIYQAKEEVNRARGSLLPGLGLTGTLGGSPNFAVSTISVLLPFLLPGNWHALDAKKQQLAANGYAYHLVGLNGFASEYALYSQVVEDATLKSIYVQQADNLREILQIVADDYSAGTATKADVAQATAQFQLARAQISQLDELTAQETAIVRKMMGLPLTVDLQFGETHPAPLLEESSTAQAIFEKVHASSPEQRQIESLIAAAKQAEFTSVWGFLTGASLNVSPDFGTSSFGHLTESAAVNLGFGYFPAVQISHLNTEALKIREREIGFEQASVIESALSSVQAAAAQVAFAEQASDNYRIALAQDIARYRAGQVDLLHVLTISNNSTAAAAQLARATGDLDRQRITLNRVLLSDEFAKIPTCRLQGASSSGGIFGFLKGVFGLGRKKSRYQSIDDLCRPLGAQLKR